MPILCCVLPPVATPPAVLQVGRWSNCSARCGGGWASREVRCMRVGGRGSPPAQVPLEECPLGEWRGDVQRGVVCLNRVPPDLHLAQPWL